jgi:hypothetical protein
MLSTTKFIDNPDRPDEFVVAHTARFDGLVDLVGKMRNENVRFFGNSTEMRHVAEIPGILIEQYCFNNGVSWAEFWADSKHIKQMCNDPDLAYFRVAPGRV